MNIWLELLFVLVRGALLSLGTLMVQHGWISEQTAMHFSGPAAIWLTAGVFVIATTLGHSAWSKVKATAAARIALMFPAGSPAALVIEAMKDVTKKSLWALARDLTKDDTDEDRQKLEKATEAVKGVLLEHGFSDSAKP